MLSFHFSCSLFFHSFYNRAPYNFALLLHFERCSSRMLSRFLYLCTIFCVSESEPRSSFTQQWFHIHWIFSHFFFASRRFFYKSLSFYFSLYHVTITFICSHSRVEDESFHLHFDVSITEVTQRQLGRLQKKWKRRKFIVKFLLT